MPDLVRGFDRSCGGAGAVETESSVSLFIDEDAVLVALHGSIGHQLHHDVRDLVDDLACDAAATAHRPVRVLTSKVTELGLQGVWLLLELRRAARPADVTLVDPSSVVLETLEMHGLAAFPVVRTPAPPAGEESSAQ